MFQSVKRHALGQAVRRVTDIDNPFALLLQAGLAVENRRASLAFRHRALSIFGLALPLGDEDIVAKISQYNRFITRCLTYLVQDPWLFVLFLGLTVGSAATEGAGVALLVPLLDGANNQGVSAFSGVPIMGGVAGLFGHFEGSTRIMVASGVIAVVLVMRGLLQYWVDVIGATIPLRLMERFGQKSYSHLLDVEMQFINSSDRGELMNAVGGYPGRVTLLLTQFASFIAAMFVLMAYGVLMLSLSWRMTILATIFVGLMSVVLRSFTSGPMSRAGRNLSEAQTDMGTLVQETLSGMKLIRLSVAEDSMRRAYGETLGRTVEAQRNVARLAALPSPFLATSAGMFICLLLVGAAVIHSGESTGWVSGILLFLFLLFRMLGPVTTMNNARNRMVSDLHAFDSLETFYEITTARRQTAGNKKLEGFKQGIAFENLSFGYAAKEGEMSIEDLSFTVDRGEMVAIVGPSGAGKTTVVGLLSRLFDPNAGRIAIDGVDLRDLKIEDWRRQISVVSQDVFIFNDTITRNICFPRTDIPMELVRKAAVQACADEFIEKMPQGYDTMLGDRGVRLSGGQQQRIAIARAIIADPALLIMDEATSHLDSITEAAIQKAVDALSKDRTTLVIAHRLSTIRKASKIVVLKDGKMVEQGPHSELVHKKGTYWEMLTHQMLDLTDDEAITEETL